MKRASMNDYGIAGEQYSKYQDYKYIKSLQEYLSGIIDLNKLIIFSTQ